MSKIKVNVIGVFLLTIFTVSNASSVSPLRIKKYPDVKFSTHFTRIELAGARLNPRHKNFTKYDPKSGYYLSFLRDGLGDRLTTLSLVLSPDGENLNIGGEAEDAQKAVLPRLTNGSGVNIGDNPQQVERKLGAKPEEVSYNRKSCVRITTYKAPISVLLNLNGTHYRRYRSWATWSYKATYEFHREKLWGIRYEANDESNAV